PECRPGGLVSHPIHRLFRIGPHGPDPLSPQGPEHPDRWRYEGFRPQIRDHRLRPLREASAARRQSRRGERGETHHQLQAAAAIADRRSRPGAVMKTPRKTIQGKLVTAMMLTSTAVLLLVGVVFVSHDFSSFRRFLVQTLETRAGILAGNSTAALAFQNHEDAGQVLDALKTDPSVVAAALYDQEGRLFATYPARIGPGDVPAVPGPIGHRFEASHLVVSAAVVEEGRPLGTLYLKSGLEELDARLRVDAIVMLLAMGGSIVVAFLLSTWLQRRLAHPILAL